MTAKEAIEYLNDPIGKGMEAHIEAVIMASQALQKEIPQKPIKEKGMLFGRCPRCKEALLHFVYCEHCGQKLDWRNKE